jgi:hypothetical protein
MPRTSVISQDTELPLGVFPLSARQNAHHPLDDVLRHAPELVVLVLGHFPAVELALQLFHGVALEALDMLEKGRSKVTLTALWGISAVQSVK